MNLNDLTIALTMRVTHPSAYAEPRDSVSHDWIAKLDAAGADILLLPNGLSDPAAPLRRRRPDLVILSGGEDLGMEPVRDAAERAVLEHCLDQAIPVLGVCRGMQLINDYYGGRTEPVEGHVAVRHTLAVDAPFDDLYPGSAETNSFHNRAISRHGLSPELTAWATDGAGLIEALAHRTAPLLGVMWHPERPGHPAGDDALIERLAREGAFWR